MIIAWNGILFCEVSYILCTNSPWGLPITCMSSLRRPNKFRNARKLISTLDKIDPSDSNLSNGLQFTVHPRALVVRTTWMNLIAAEVLF